MKPLNKEQWRAALDIVNTSGFSSESRAAQLDTFFARGFPQRGDEDWKYTRTTSVEGFTAAWLEGGRNPTTDAAVKTRALRTAAEMLDDQDVEPIVFVDGELACERARLILPTGIRIEREPDPELAQDDRRQGAFRSLNAALCADPLLVTVAAETRVEQPLYFIYLASPGGAALASPRIAVRVAEGASIDIVQHFAAMADTGDTQLTNAFTRFELAPGASAGFYRLQEYSRDALYIQETAVSLAADASWNGYAIDAGSALARNELSVDLCGPGAAAHLNGVYLCDGSQHMDNHLYVDHREPHTRSFQHYAGIAADRSTAVFNGKVMVHEGADGTDASQSNRNLLLSDEATVNTKPELEIYADDVKCAHGATVGQLDDNALFYLRSRGIDEDEARRLLTRAFAYDCISGIANDRLRQRFEDLLLEKLPFPKSELVGVAA